VALATESADWVRSALGTRQSRVRYTIISYLLYRNGRPSGREYINVPRLYILCFRMFTLKMEILQIVVICAFGKFLVVVDDLMYNMMQVL